MSENEELAPSEQQVGEIQAQEPVNEATTNAADQDDQGELLDIVTDPEQRLMMLQEIEVLTKCINTSYYLPKYNDSKRGEDPRVSKKINSSVQLNYYSFQQMQLWGNRIIYLTERLGC